MATHAATALPPPCTPAGAQRVMVHVNPTNDVRWARGAEIARAHLQRLRRTCESAPAHRTSSADAHGARAVQYLGQDPSPSTAAPRCFQQCCRVNRARPMLQCLSRARVCSCVGCRLCRVYAGAGSCVAGCVKCGRAVGARPIAARTRFRLGCGAASRGVVAGVAAADRAKCGPQVVAARLSL